MNSMTVWGTSYIYLSTVPNQSLIISTYRDKLKQDSSAMTTTAQASSSSSSSSSSSTPIQTHHTYIPSPLPTAPAFDLHLTRFRDTLLLWAGTTSPSDGSGGLAEESEEKRIAADWSVAMPSNRVRLSTGDRRNVG